VNPTSFTPTIEVGHAGRLLRRVEAHHDQQGWHSHANMHLYVVYDHHDVVTGYAIERVMRTMGQPVRNSRYSAQPMLSTRMFAAAHRDNNLDTVQALCRFALNIAYADTDLVRKQGSEYEAEGLEAFRHLIRMPGILGYIVCSEAHQLLGPQADDAHRRKIRFANIPESVEIRTAIMVDVENRVHDAHRRRGETAELFVDGDLTGRVVSSLRMLMDASARRVPEDQAGFDARYWSDQD
jgi:hypothetical protein